MKAKTYRERGLKAIKTMREKGQHIGKPRHYDHTKIKELLRKKVPVKLISEKTGVPRGTVYYVKKRLESAPNQVNNKKTSKV